MCLARIYATLHLDCFYTFSIVKFSWKPLQQFLQIAIPLVVPESTPRLSVLVNTKIHQVKIKAKLPFRCGNKSKSRCAEFAG